MFEFVQNDGFYFGELTEADKAEIIKVVYAASATGYTSLCGSST